MSKKCSKCGEIKPLANFYRRAIGKDGYRGVCKSCSGVLYKYPYTPDQEKSRENKKRHYLLNIDKIRERNKQWRKDNAETLREKKRQYSSTHPRSKEQSRAKHLRKYGLTLGDFERMKQEQGGLCAICHEPKLLDVDHDHKTNKVRGLLCGSCNRAIGLLRDSPIFADEASKYLVSTSARGINWSVFYE